MTRITSDVEQLRSFVGMGLLQLVSAIAMTVGSVVALFALNPLLAAVTMLTIPATAVIVIYFMRVVRPLFSQIQARLGVLNTILQENLAGVRMVQAFAREPYEAQRYRAANEGLLDINIKTVHGLSSAFPLIFLISNLGTLAVIWIGGYQVFDGALTIGGLVAFNTYLALLIQPLMMLGMIMAQVTRAAVGAERK
jgi:ATP-binding cassette subfamily B protein